MIAPDRPVARQAILKQASVPGRGNQIVRDARLVDVTAFVRAQLYIRPITSLYGMQEIFRPDEPRLRKFTSQEIVSWLRDGGLPVLAIAQVARVERKCVYAWLEGGAVRDSNQERLEKLHRLLSEGQQADLRSLYRMWNRQLEGEETLSGLLSAEVLDLSAIKRALGILWPVARKYQEQSAKRARPHGELRDNPIVDEMNEVIISNGS